MEQMKELKELNKTKEEILGTSVGSNKPKIGPKRVFVQEVDIVVVSNKDGKDVGRKVVFRCKHPDAEMPIEISGAKYLKNDKLVSGGVWLNLDAEQKIGYNSAAGILLRFFGYATLSAFKGQTVDTVTDDAGYLAIKSY